MPNRVILPAIIVQLTPLFLLQYSSIVMYCTRRVCCVVTGRRLTGRECYMYCAGAGGESRCQECVGRSSVCLPGVAGGLSYRGQGGVSWWCSGETEIASWALAAQGVWTRGCIAWSSTRPGFTWVCPCDAPVAPLCLLLNLSFPTVSCGFLRCCEPAVVLGAAVPHA